MSMHSVGMASQVDNAVQDLGPLAWVLGEVRTSLESSSKAVKRFVRDAAQARGVDLANVDSSQLRLAKQQLHQVAGALEMVDLAQPAHILHAMEGAVQRFIQAPEYCSDAAASTLEKAGFALIAYLESLLAGRDVSAVALFPQYAEVQQLAAATRIHPADLWHKPWRWQKIVLPAANPVPLTAEKRAEMDTPALGVMRTFDGASAGKLKTLAHEIAAGSAGEQQTYWGLLAAFFEAVEHQLLANDIYTKRTITGALTQAKEQIKTPASLNQRLAQDLLFFAQYALNHQGGHTQLPLLSAVASAYALRPDFSLDYSKRIYGNYDPAVLIQARKRIAAVKDTWSLVTAGESNKYQLVKEQIQAIAESLGKILPNCADLGQALNACADAIVKQGKAPDPSVAMEVATSLLYIEAALEDADLSNPQLQSRTDRLAERISQAQQGGVSQPLEPWMEELYRKVSDKQNMGSVVGELKVSLGELEKLMDQYFRNPQDLSALQQVPGKLSQMRGVMSVLGLDHAIQAVLWMRDHVESLLVSGSHIDPGQSALFEKLGNNLGALGFLIDMLSYQPLLAKKLFIFDADNSELQPLMGRAKANKEAAADAALLPAHSTQDFDLVIPEASVSNVPDQLMPAPAMPSAETVDFDFGEALSPVLTQPSHLIQPDSAAAVSTEPLTKTSDTLFTDTTKFFVHPAASVITDDSVLTSIEFSLSDFGSNPEQKTDVVVEPDNSSSITPAPAPAAPLTSVQTVESRAKDSQIDIPPATDLSDSVEVLTISTDTEGEVALTELQTASQRSAKDDANSINAPLSIPTVSEQRPAQANVAAVQDNAQDLDDELLAIFLEEAREVIGQGLLAIDNLRQNPSDAQDLTTLRRSFHTLKGSSRMVGLHHFGQAAWSLEQLLNAWLGESKPANTALLDTSEQAMHGFAGWVGALLLDKHDASYSYLTFQASADALRVEQKFLPLETGGLGLPTSDSPGIAESADITSSPDIAATTPPESAQTDTTEHVAQGSEEAVSGFTIDKCEPNVVGALAETRADFLQIATASADTQMPSSLGERQIDDASAQSAEPSHTPLQKAQPIPAELDESAQFKQIGDIQIGLALYNVFLGEADDWSRMLVTQLAEWAMEPHALVPEQAVALAHSIAGTSGTVGYAPLSHFARQLEHALARDNSLGEEANAHRFAKAYVESAEEIRRLLHQFAAGIYAHPHDRNIEQLEVALKDEVGTQDATPTHLHTEDLLMVESDFPFAKESLDHKLATIQEIDSALTSGSLTLDEPLSFPSSSSVDSVVHSDLPITGAETQAAEFVAAHEGVRTPAYHHDDDIDAVDAIDENLFPIFEEEAVELLPEMGSALREWHDRPENLDARGAVLRVLHTLKGSARLAGAMRLGEMAHRMESAIEILGAEGARREDVDGLLVKFDDMDAAFNKMKALFADQQQNPTSFGYLAQGASSASTTADATTVVGSDLGSSADPTSLPNHISPTVSAVSQDQESFSQATEFDSLANVDVSNTDQQVPTRTLYSVRSSEAATQTVRVRSQLLDRLLGQAGEVMISRARLENEIGVQLRTVVSDLTSNLERLRKHLRDIEVQTESQMQSRLAFSKEVAQSFDPLEFDRFTRVQELTRMMAESVNDVATVQRNVQRVVDATEGALVAQARQTRELQRDLLRTRMVEFDSISERLYRVVRQAAKESGKQVRMDIVGASIEVDRGVLERMTPAFEHLLRNSVAHGIEDGFDRTAIGKEAIGNIVVTVRQEGNDVSVEFADDGGGLNIARILERAQTKGIIQADSKLSDEEIYDLIFTPGFSTAEQVTTLSGRGVGMDVVRSEVQALGGRIETSSTRYKGTQFRLILPLTTAVTQVVMLRIGKIAFGVPANILELVRRVTAQELAQAYAEKSYVYLGERLSFQWAGALLQASAASDEPIGRTTPVVIFRSAAQRIALHVDEVLGNQEVVVKNLGAQLSRLPGLAGMSVLASGAVVLIYNPVALATVYSERAAEFVAEQERQRASGASPVVDADGVSFTPLVMVVDDSITVRRVTQRLLQREGYRVVLANDGLHAIEKLAAEELPSVVLSDIEMPRMDGFDLARNIRSDERLKQVPIIMITSRIADKHRDHAMELGVNHYLGKPYSEEELLALIARYCEEKTASANAI